MGRPGAPGRTAPAVRPREPPVPRWAIQASASASGKPRIRPSRPWRPATGSRREAIGASDSSRATAGAASAGQPGPSRRPPSQASSTSSMQATVTAHAEPPRRAQPAAMAVIAASSASEAAVTTGNDASARALAAVREDPADCLQHQARVGPLQGRRWCFLVRRRSQRGRCLAPSLAGGANRQPGPGRRQCPRRQARGRPDPSGQPCLLHVGPEGRVSQQRLDRQQHQQDPADRSGRPAAAQQGGCRQRRRHGDRRQRQHRPAAALGCRPDRCHQQQVCDRQSLWRRPDVTPGLGDRRGGRQRAHGHPSQAGDRRGNQRHRQCTQHHQPAKHFGPGAPGQGVGIGFDLRGCAVQAALRQRERRRGQHQGEQAHPGQRLQVETAAPDPARDPAGAGRGPRWPPAPARHRRPPSRAGVRSTGPASGSRRTSSSSSISAASASPASNWRLATVGIAVTSIAAVSPAASRLTVPWYRRGRITRSDQISPTTNPPSSTSLRGLPQRAQHERRQWHGQRRATRPSGRHDRSGTQEHPAGQQRRGRVQHHHVRPGHDHAATARQSQQQHGRRQDPGARWPLAR